MRAILTSCTALLVIAALFWGNCLSCPQVIQSHSCCHHSKPVSKDCRTQALRSFVKAERGAAAPVEAGPVAVVEPAVVKAAAVVVPVAIVASPPDLFALHGVFRI
jgi:hypothetical protein